jgi:sodium pump decarboxylase gamma subunit
MIETLKQGLLITVIGMGIVFAMILILWGIMVLLVKLTNRPEKEEVAQENATSFPEPEPVAETAPSDASALAAAIAVAYALSAKPKTLFASDTQSIPTGSAWLAAGRARQVARQINRGRSA